MNHAPRTPNSNQRINLRQLEACAARGGVSSSGFDIDVPVAWPVLRQAAGIFDPMAGVRRLHGLWRGPRRDERRDAALLRVHRVEQAWLLREFMGMVLGELSAGESDAYPISGAGLSWQAWRARARRELALAQTGGLAVARELLVATLWHPSFHGPDGAVALARAAVGLDPGAKGLCGLARARLAADAPVAALAAAERAREECGPDEPLPPGLELCQVRALAGWSRQVAPR
jgi:hypothetical protein